MAHGFSDAGTTVTYYTSLTKSSRNSDFTAAAANSYGVDHVSSGVQVVATLPATASDGDEIEFSQGDNVGGVKVLVSATHLRPIRINNRPSGSTSASYYAGGAGSALRIRYYASENAWVASSVVGDWASDLGTVTDAMNSAERFAFSTDNGANQNGYLGQISAVRPQIRPGRVGSPYASGAKISVKSRHHFTNLQTTSGAGLKTVLSPKDMTYNQRDLTANGSIAERAGLGGVVQRRYGRGYDWTGSTSLYLSRGTDAGFDNNSESHTCVFIVDTLGAQRTLFNMVSRESVYVNSDGSIAYAFNGTGVNFTSAAGLVVAGTLAHTLTIRRDDTLKTVVMKLNGVTVASGTYTATIATANAGIQLGAQASGANPLDGVILEYRYWGNAVSQDKLDAVVHPHNFRFRNVLEGNEKACWLLHEPVNIAKDFGTGARDLTVTGTPRTGLTVDGYQRFAAGYGYFTTGAYLSMADAAFGLTGDFAASIAMTYDGASGGNEVIFALDTGSAGYDYVVLFIDTSARICYQHHVATAASTLTGTALSAGPHTITARRSGTSIVVTVDGVTAIDGTASSVSPTGTTPRINIGINNSGTAPAEAFISGTIQEVRVWGATNTPSQTLLSQIADPSDNTYRRKREGNELACYFFGNGDELLDTSDNLRTSTANGTPTGFRVPGTAAGRTRFIQGVDLDGTNDYYSGATHPNVIDASWFVAWDTDSTSAVKRVLYMVRNGGSTVLEVSQRAADGNLQITLAGQTLAMGALTTASTTTNRLWITRVSSTGAIRARLNGGTVVTATGTTGSLTATHQTIGADDTGAAGQFYDGGVYDVRSWSSLQPEANILDTLADIANLQFSSRPASTESAIFLLGNPENPTSGVIAGGSGWQLSRANNGFDAALYCTRDSDGAEIDEIVPIASILETRKSIETSITLQANGTSSTTRVGDVQVYADGVSVYTKSGVRLFANADLVAQIGGGGAPIVGPALGQVIE